jgi:hypothetical protein
MPWQVQTSPNPARGQSTQQPGHPPQHQAFAAMDRRRRARTRRGKRRAASSAVPSPPASTAQSAPSLRSPRLGTPSPSIRADALASRPRGEPRGTRRDRTWVPDIGEFLAEAEAEMEAGRPDREDAPEGAGRAGSWAARCAPPSDSGTAGSAVRARAGVPVDPPHHARGSRRHPAPLAASRERSYRRRRAVPTSSIRAARDPGGGPRPAARSAPSRKPAFSSR